MSFRRFRLLATLLLTGVAILVATPPPVYAGRLNMMAGGLAVAVPVQNFNERRFATVMKQRYDYSCGSAALASLLTYHYHDRVSEAEVFKSMYKHGDRAKIIRKGFSLLDMKEYLKRRGYRADGYRVSLNELAANKIPAVVLLNHEGYLHFVIVKGVLDNTVLVGDPAVGIKSYRRKTFEHMWNGVVFIIRSDKKIARASFNRRSDWDLAPTAPLGRALSRSSLAMFTLLQPSRNDF